MDKMTNLQALIEEHGNYRPDLGARHPENKKLLPRVAREVALEFKNGGRRGYGYEVAAAEDIFQRMLLKMADDGVTPEDLRHPEAQGRVRAYARHAALREVEAAKANVRTKDGSRVLSVTSLILPTEDQPLDTDAILTLEAHEAASAIGLPEDELLRVDLLGKLQALAEDIISKVPSLYRDAVSLYFVDGLTVEEVAKAMDRSYDWASKTIQRGRKSLHGDEVASLLGVRAYFNPSAKRPGRMKDVGTPTALLDLVRS